MADTSAKHYAITPHNATQEVLLQKIVDLEDQRNALLHQQFRLKSLWNTTVTIHRPPIELLSQFFCAVKGESIPGLSSKMVWGKKWVHIRLVCRYWREVADATPALWRAVDFGSESRRAGNYHWLSLCLSRSAAMPFDVKFQHVFPIQDAQLKLLLSHSRRIRTLHLPFIQNDSCAVLANLLLHNKMPALEALLYLGTRSVVDHDMYDELHISLDHYPRLQFLELSHTTAPRDPLLYGQLRSLALTKCSGGDLTYKAFLDMLSNARTLQTLSIFDFLNHLAYDVREDHRRVSLPQLTSLTLGTHALEDSAKFLTHVAFPAIVTLQVEADLIHVDVDDLPVTFPRLLPNQPAEYLSFWKQICGVYLAVCEQDYELSAYTASSSDSQLAKQAVALAIQFKHSSLPWDHRFIHGLLDAVDLLSGINLVRLSINVSVLPDCSDTWRRVFRAFPLLEYFSLTGDSDGHVAGAWRGLRYASIASAAAIAEIDGPQPHSEGGQAVACPRLHTINIGGYFNASGELFEEMIWCLRDRADTGGARLTKLVTMLIPCEEQSWRDLEHAYTPILKGLVAEVECHWRV